MWPQNSRLDAAPHGRAGQRGKKGSMSYRSGVDDRDGGPRIGVMRISSAGPLLQRSRLFFCPRPRPASAFWDDPGLFFTHELELGGSKRKVQTDSAVLLKIVW